MAPRRVYVDEDTSSFIQGGVSILAASSDSRNQPTIVRCVGCSVSRDRTKVTVLAPSYEPFLDAVRASKTIAVTFTQPSTHKAIQLKGRDARIVRRLKDDLSGLSRYADAFVQDVCPLGFSEELIRAIVSYDSATLRAIAFGPTSAFVQTPGPRAGTPIA